MLASDTYVDKIYITINILGRWFGKMYMLELSQITCCDLIILNEI